VSGSTAESHCIRQRAFFMRTDWASTRCRGQERIEDEAAAVNPREGAKGGLAARSYSAGDSSLCRGACAGDRVIQG
jgi:hypothetical protein